ncbi:MAG: tetratricopeptide repeat protein [Desmonostoc vinosum HA7617-LM4]|jgi:tetratricopeptide (TPR) repeat protein|nr:tetratricopeptide repeat protein [Desmonostoc vinosum HA7617-LM4]
MKLKKQHKSVFVQPLSCMTLSIITAIGISPSVLAATAPGSLHLPKQQPQKIAQFSGADTPERSQLLQEINALYNQRDFKGAEEKLRQFIKKFPDVAFGHFQLGNVLFRQNKPEAAISAYQEAIKLRPKYALAYNAIGVVYASQDRWTEALREYNQALEINPEYGEALTNLAQVLWQTNKRTEALASLEKALNIFKAQNRNEKVYQVEQIMKQMKALDDPSVS